MRALVDTNVILDVVCKREPLFAESAAVLQACGAGVSGYLLASQTTDIFYLVCRSLRNAKMSDAEIAAKNVVKKIADNLRVVDVTPADVKAALASEMFDYEDALLAYRAKRLKVDYVITRNLKDFAQSPVPAIEPSEFIKLLGR